MSPRPVILFDIMDTLVYNPFNKEIPDYFGLSTPLLLEQKDPAAWPAFELGQIDERTYLRCYFRDRRTFNHARFLTVIADAYRWLDDAESMLRQLAESRIRIHAFSNYPTWYRTIEDRLHLSRFLEWTFVSCHTGVRKPSPGAYQHVLKTLGQPANQYLVIDDQRQNCEAAIDQGMDAIQFVNMHQLRLELRQRGLLS